MEKFTPELAFIHEAELKESMIGPCHITGYEIITAPTLASGISRTICYRKRNSSFKPITITDTSIDLIAFQFNNIVVVGLYRGFKLPHGCTPSDQFKKYIGAIESFIPRCKDIIIMGDFNIDPKRDINKWHGKALEEFIIRNGLTQHVKGTTRRRTILKSNSQ